MRSRLNARLGLQRWNPGAAIVMCIKPAIRASHEQEFEKGKEGRPLSPYDVMELVSEPDPHPDPPQLPRSRGGIASRIRVVRTKIVVIVPSSSPDLGNVR